MLSRLPTAPAKVQTMSTPEVSHIAYRTIDGRQYVLVSHAEAEMDAALDDALEVAAKLAEQWLTTTGDRGLAAAIRSMKRVTSGE